MSKDQATKGYNSKVRAFALSEVQIGLVSAELALQNAKGSAWSEHTFLRELAMSVLLGSPTQTLAGSVSARLRNGPATAAELALAVGAAEDDVYKVLNWLSQFDELNLAIGPGPDGHTRWFRQAA